MQELKRNKRGRESDERLLRVINTCPGLSQYELSKKLNWPSGHTDGALRRLLNEKLIIIKIVERNGRLLNLVYPKDTQPSNIIEVPTNLLHTENQTWMESAFVYALDSTTIGIASHEIHEWTETSCFMEETPIKKVEEKLVLQIPMKFTRFYNVERKHKVVSINGNNILVTISGNLVDEKKYPS